MRAHDSDGEPQRPVGSDTSAAAANVTQLVEEVLAEAEIGYVVNGARYGLTDAEVDARWQAYRTKMLGRLAALLGDGGGIESID